MKSGTNTVLSYSLPETSYQGQLQSIPLTVTRITKTADLLAYRKGWRKLSAGMPMQSPEWILTWLKYYTIPKDELCVLLFHDPNGSLVGLAPLYVQKEWGRAIVRLLGSGDVCTNHTTWLAAPGLEKQIGFEVAKFLLDHDSDWDCLHLEWVDDDNLPIKTTVECMKQKGCLLRTSPLPSCWKIELPPTWDEYLQMLSRKHRKQCIRLHRKYLDSGIVQVHKVVNQEDLEKGFKIFLQLHAARWSDPAKPQGVFSDDRFCSFHRKVAEELLKKQQLHLIWLEYEGIPFASEYQFVDKNTVYAYQAGMDPSYGKLRPGKLSLMISIQFAIAHGCRSFDLLRGDESYKTHYRATPTACNDILIWPDRISGRVGYTLYYTNSRMRYYARIGRYLFTQWLRND